jgi:enoyl-CoA hydratase
MDAPVIAAVNGAAAGGGMALALAADIVLANESSYFMAPFTRLGMSGGDVGLSWLLPRLVGLARAREILLSGRTVHAEEAERIGLVSRLVNAGELLAEAGKLADDIANAGPGPAMTKRVLDANVDADSIEDAIRLENALQSVVLGSHHKSAGS